MTSRWFSLLFGVSLALLGAACSSASAPSPAASDAGGTTDVHGGTTTSGSATCAGFGGTCLASPTGSCASGTVPVSGGSDALCGSNVRSCCVPTAGKTGKLTLAGDYGLACTAHDFNEFSPGSCGDSVTCQVGCTCGKSNGAASCDCSRGGPPTTTPITCALFGCGAITCGVGCTCSDAKASRCTCP